MFFFLFDFAEPSIGVEFPDYSLVKKMVTDSSGQPFLMPFLGTYYYNGVPSYANMDAASLLEAIRKQM